MITSTNKVPIISDDDTEIRNEQGNVLLFALITMATVEDAAAVVRDNNWGDRTVTPQYMKEFYLGVTEQTKTDFTKRCMEAMHDRQRTDINWKDDEAQAMRNDPKGGANFYNKYGGAPYIKGGTFSSRGGLPALPPMPRGGGQCDCAGSWLPQFGQMHEWSPIKRLEGNTCQGWMCSRAVHAGGTEDRPVRMRLPSAPYAQEERATDPPGTDPWRTTSTFGTPDPSPRQGKTGGREPPRMVKLGLSNRSNEVKLTRSDIASSAVAEMQAAGVEDIEERRVQAEYVRGSLTGPYHLTVTEEELAHLMEEGKLQVTTKEGTVELDVMILNELNEMVTPARKRAQDKSDEEHEQRTRDAQDRRAEYEKKRSDEDDRTIKISYTPHTKGGLLKDENGEPTGEFREDTEAIEGRLLDALWESGLTRPGSGKEKAAEMVEKLTFHQPHDEGMFLATLDMHILFQPETTDEDMRRVHWAQMRYVPVRHGQSPMEGHMAPRTCEVLQIKKCCLRATGTGTCDGKRKVCEVKTEAQEANGYYEASRGNRPGGGGYIHGRRPHGPRAVGRTAEERPGGRTPRDGTQQTRKPATRHQRGHVP